MPLDDLAERFARAPYNARLGIVVERLAPDHALIRVPYKDENSNPGRALHGGVMASVIDIGGTLAAWSGLAADKDFEAGTVDLSVNYLAAAIGEDIVAEASVLRRGKEITYCEVDVRNDGGKRIAKGLVTHRAFERALLPGDDSRQLFAGDELGQTQAGDVPRLAQAMMSVPFMARLGLRITDMSGGHARVEMPFIADNADHGEIVHEGALAALVDTTGAMASWSVVGIDFRFKASTVGLHVNYHTPAVREDVVAEARTRRRNNEIFLNEVAVRGRTSGRVVATGAVTYRIVVT
jgi:uncharacterized protein (TIGR00369 family)